MATAIATVLNITGEAWARDEDGNLRQLQPGDTLFEGETLVTGDHSDVQLSFPEGAPVDIGSGQEIVMTAQLAQDENTAQQQADNGNAQNAGDEGSVLDQDIQDILAAINAGDQDLLANEEAPAAGNGTGGEASAGGDNDFTQLTRIALNASPLTFDFDPTALLAGPAGPIGAPGDAVADIVPNTPPTVITPIIEGMGSDDGEQINGQSGDRYDMSQHFADADGDTLIYSANNLPTGLHIDPNTGIISGQIDYSASQGGANDNGTYNVTVSASDGTDSVDMDFRWFVFNPPPVATENDATTAENTAATGNVITDDDGHGADHDTAPDDDPLTVDHFTVNGTDYTAGGTANLTNGGTLTIDSDGKYVFDPGTDYSGDVPDNITYTINDGNGSTDTAALNLGVVGLDIHDDTPDDATNDIKINEGEQGTFTVNVTHAAAGSTLNLGLSSDSTDSHPATPVDDYKTSFEYSLDGGNTWTTYDAGTGVTLTNGGNQTIEVRVQTVDDNLVEPPETFHLDATLHSDTNNVSATGTATIIDDDTEPSITSANVRVSEEDADANWGYRDTPLPDDDGYTSDPQHDPDPDQTDSHTASGQLDVEGSSPDLQVTLDVNGLPSDWTSGGDGIHWSYGGNDHQVIYGYTGSDASSNHVIKVSIDDSGHYNVDLLAPLDHPINGESHVTDDDGNWIPDPEDVLSLDVGVTVSDGVNPDATGTITVGIEDDSPDTHDVSNDITLSSDQDTNLMLVLDTSGSMTRDSEVDGKSRLEVMQEGALNLLDSYSDMGDVKVRLVVFSKDADTPHSEWVTVADAKDYINGLGDNDMSGGTNYDAALAGAEDAFGSNGTIGDAQNVLYFLSDGAPTLGTESGTSHSGNSNTKVEPDKGDGIDSDEQQAWHDFLEAHGINAYAIGVGDGDETDGQLGDLSEYLDPIGYDGTTHSADDQTIIVDDLNQFNQTLSNTVTPGTVTGSLFGDGDGTGFGADGPGYVSSITVGGVTYNYDGSDVTAPDGSSFTFDDGKLTITTTLGAELVVDMADASYAYTPQTDETGTENIGFTVVDADGDGASSTLTMTINEGADVSVEGAAAVSEEGLDDGLKDGQGYPDNDNDDTTNDATTEGDVSVSGTGNLDVTLVAPDADTDPGLTSGGQDISWSYAGNNGSDHQTLLGHVGNTPGEDNNIIKISIDDTGHYTVDLLGPLDHPINDQSPGVPSGVEGPEDVLSFGVGVHVEDELGHTADGTFTVNVEDDSPEASHITLGPLDADDDGATATVDSDAFEYGADGPGDPHGHGITLDGITATINGETVTNFDLSDYGALTTTADGDATFTLDSDADGSKALAEGDKLVIQANYTLTDADGDTASNTIDLTIKGANDDPTAGTLEDLSNVDGDDINLNISGAFSDPDGDTLTFSASDLPDGLSIDSNTGIISGTLDNHASYDGDGNGTHDYSVTVTANDGHGGGVDQTFIWTVNNVAPVAKDDSKTAEEGNSALMVDADHGVLSNDHDGSPDSDPLTVSQVGGDASNVGTTIAGSHGGQFTINDNGSYTFDLDGDFTGLAVGDTQTTSVDYQVSDGNGGFDTATLTIEVTGTPEGHHCANTTDPETANEINGEAHAGNVDLEGNDGVQNIINGGDYAANQKLVGGDQDDVIRSGDHATGNGHLVGGAGSDILEGGSHLNGNQTLDGGEDSDCLFGGDDVGGNQALYGGLGDDYLSGGSLVGGNQRLQGGMGNDHLVGGDEIDGNQTLLGDAGNDVLIGGSQIGGNQKLEGDLGHDRLEGGDHIKGNQALDGGTGDDYLVGGDHVHGNQTLWGGAGNDILTAGDDVQGNQTLWGGAGNDVLTAGDDVSGNTHLYGGDGSDILIGGSGNDTLTGGDGADTFVWNAGDQGDAGTPAEDTVTDFDTSEGDKLDLSDLLQGEQNASDLGAYLHFDSNGSGTTIHVSSDGGFTSSGDNAQADQTIQLQDVDLTNLGNSDDDIAQQLIDNGNLDIDG